MYYVKYGLYYIKRDLENEPGVAPKLISSSKLSV